MTLSLATKANWRRLKTDPAEKLQHGANKTRSSRKIYPMEYLRHKENLSFVEKVLAIVQKNALLPENTIYTIACLFLEQHNILHQKHVKNVLNQYDWSFEKELAAIKDIPLDEWDILGFLYQCMQSEGRKNRSGSYYTPESVVKDIVKDHTIADGKKILDPACGSGSFLLAFDTRYPELLFGCDNDEIAVFIARINLLCKYKEHEFVPQIYCLDFLTEECCGLLTQKFDCIAGNPPWGAKNKKHNNIIYNKVKDTFSLFLLKSYSLLKDNGKLSFLLPQAVLNVKTHKYIRSFMIKECCLESIEYISGKFTGVMTDYVNIKLRKAAAAERFIISENGRTTQVKSCDVLADTDHILSYKSELDEKLIKKIDQQKKYDLSESIFALGIVTGDNKTKLSDTPKKNYEAVYTGKDVKQYTLSSPGKYIFYDRTQLQQVAKDEYYRAGEKLVYKFISKELVFAYDNSGSLLLNSANMLIPQIDELSIKTILALLNSNVLRYYYKVRFTDVKILKGNLIQLPLPYISKALQQEFETMVNQLLTGNISDHAGLQDLIYKCYELSEDDIIYIKSVLLQP